jgi:hypothetical protein
VKNKIVDDLLFANDFPVSFGSRTKVQTKAGEAFGSRTFVQTKAGEAFGSRTFVQTKAGEAFGSRTFVQTKAGEAFGSRTFIQTKAGEAFGSRTNLPAERFVYFVRILLSSYGNNAEKPTIVYLRSIANNCFFTSKP